MKLTTNIAKSVMPIITFVGAISSLQGAAVITISEQGSDVLVVGTGSFDVSALIFIFDIGTSTGAIQGNPAGVFVGDTGPTSVALFGGLNGPTAIGTGSTFYNADSSAGQAFGVYRGDIGSGLETYLVVPSGYLSGTPLSSNATFLGSDLGGLGLSEGSYVWTWGSGTNADSLTLNIIPESSTFSLACFGVTGLLLRRRCCRTRRHS